MPSAIPKTQTVALVREQGGEVTFVDNYPVPTPTNNEVLAKVLYTGVCQSGNSLQKQR
jgi:propanol-preferring alcohol dehydrogenase